MISYNVDKDFSIFPLLFLFFYSRELFIFPFLPLLSSVLFLFVIFRNQFFHVSLPPDSTANSTSTLMNKTSSRMSMIRKSDHRELNQAPLMYQLTDLYLRLMLLKMKNTTSCHSCHCKY